MKPSDVNIDLHMVNKTLHSHKLNHNNIFLSFFYKGDHVSCYWHPASKDISLLISRHEFSDEELELLKKNFSTAQWL